MSCQAFGYIFTLDDLLDEALTHSSFGNEQKVKNNERLEYLGDSVLGACTTHLLFDRFPNASEGEMTRMRSRLVRTEGLAAMARAIKLGESLRLGRGEDASGGRERDTLLENTFEALVGAIFLDGGFDACREWLWVHLNKQVDGWAKSPVHKDPRSALQELLQGRHKVAPIYRVVGQEGEEHCPTYLAEVLLNDTVLGQGRGARKKEAYRMAASAALKTLDGEER